MLIEILFAIIQAATEFLPISSSGHLALVSNLIGEPDLFLFTALHLASLIAVLIFMRKEIFGLFRFRREDRKLWVYLIIATLPAAVFGLLFKDSIESSFSSFLFLGIGFLLTAFILFITKFARVYSKLNLKNSFLIGVFQALALFPGISRSGMTISSAMVSGVDKEKAVKFSFLMFIPVALGAFLLELSSFYISFNVIIAFFVCLVLSLLFLNLLFAIVRKGKFWIFSIYCLIMGIISLILYFR